MMEAAQTSETLVNSYQFTRRYNPEDSHLYIRLIVDTSFAVCGTPLCHILKEAYCLQYFKNVTVVCAVALYGDVVPGGFHETRTIYYLLLAGTYRHLATLIFSLNQNNEKCVITFLCGSSII
jgi:hypothetical protein